MLLYGFPVNIEYGIGRLLGVEAGLDLHTYFCSTARQVAFEYRAASGNFNVYLVIRGLKLDAGSWIYQFSIGVNSTYYRIGYLNPFHGLVAIRAVRSGGKPHAFFFTFGVDALGSH